MAKNNVQTSIVPDAIKEQLAIARAIEDDNKQLAVAFYREIVKQSDSNNLLPVFYGERAYELINSCDVALNSLFILNCADSVFSTIKYKTKIGSPNAWAEIGTPNNSSLLNFFTWVGKEKTITPKDYIHFNELKNAMQEQTRYFNVSGRVRTLSIVDIIKGLSAGQIKLQGGELK